MASDLLGILNGKLPEASKEDLRLAAKRTRDRKRYAEKTHINWKQNDPSSDSGLRDVLQSGVQLDEDDNGAVRTQPPI